MNESIYNLPPEWAPQRALWLAWPHNNDTWGPVKKEVREVYVRVCRAVCRFQDLYLITRNKVELLINNPELGKLESPWFHIVEYTTDDCWLRDCGGLTIQVQGGLNAMLNFKFNSWGGKYPPWDSDDAVPLKMAWEHDLPVIEVDYVLEGGALDVNGRGHCLVSESCLLDPRRNQAQTRESASELLGEYLGVTTPLWLAGSIAGDDTDGHVDETARFVNEHTIFRGRENNKADDNYGVLKDNGARISAYCKWLNFEVVDIPMPPPIVVAGLRTPASYLNFLIINGAVLVPSFEVPNEDRVFAIFEKYFPGRVIVPIPCRALTYGQGGLHCISMQVAA